MVIHIVRMPAPPLKPMPPAKATAHIRAKASSDSFLILYTDHATEQMAVRDLLSGDVMHVLRYGFVYDAGTPATQNTFFKYKMEGTTPNSDGRVVRVVVIPAVGCEAKIVTVMWRDETGGSSSD
jgi:hypothetical protein